MISPHPPRLRIKRRKTVSVTPAIGASTVAGAISTPPMDRRVGTSACGTRTASPSTPRGIAGFSKCLRTQLFYLFLRKAPMGQSPAHFGVQNDPNYSGDSVNKYV